MRPLIPLKGHCHVTSLERPTQCRSTRHRGLLEKVLMKMTVISAIFQIQDADALAQQIHAKCFQAFLTFRKQYTGLSHSSCSISESHP